MTAIFAIIKRLLASNRISFILTALVVLCATSSGAVVLSNGNYTWLLAALTPFFFVFYAFSKLMHLAPAKRITSSAVSSAMASWPSAFPWSTQPSINGLTRPIPPGL